MTNIKSCSLLASIITRKSGMLIMTETVVSIINGEKIGLLIAIEKSTGINVNAEFNNLRNG